MRRTLRDAVRGTAVLGVAVGLLLGGCAGQDGGHGPADPGTSGASGPGVEAGDPVGSGPPPSPHPIELDPDRTMPVGETFEEDGVSVYVDAVRTRMTGMPTDADQPPRGHRWVGIDARTCFETNGRRQLDVGSYLWAALGTNGIGYPGRTPATSVWPLPQYPGYGRLAAGSCTAGWVVVPVPVGVPVRDVVLTWGDGTARAAWSLLG